MVYVVIGIALLLLVFILYIVLSICTVNRLVRRILKNADESDEIRRKLGRAQEKLICEMRASDRTCTVADRLYCSEETVTAKALKTVDSQIKFYFDTHSETLKKEAVYQHYLTYERHLRAFTENESAYAAMRTRFESYRKNALLGGFAEAAYARLPAEDGNRRGILGFGLMRLPIMEDGEVDIVQSMAMADCMLQQGYTYFDTAYFYLDGRSESVARQILCERYPRDRFELADKMPVGHLKEASDVERIFAEQLARTGADYFDYYLLHALNNNSYEKQSKKFGVFEFVAAQKEKGTVRNVGFSFHDKPEVLEKILNEHPEVDFVQLQLNYYDWESKDVQSRRCYEVARAHGKQIVVMEPIKGGNLAYMPKNVMAKIPNLLKSNSPATLALRFIAGKYGIMTVLSGMSTLQQAIENTRSMQALQPLSPDESKQLLMAAEDIRKIPTYPCTRCRYCLEVCPKHLPIPEIISAMNRRLRGGTESILHANRCISCGACENACPQKIAIRKIMAEGAKT